MLFNVFNVRNNYNHYLSFFFLPSTFVGHVEWIPTSVSPFLPIFPRRKSSFPDILKCFFSHPDWHQLPLPHLNSLILFLNLGKKNLFFFFFSSSSQARLEWHFSLMVTSIWLALDMYLIVSGLTRPETLNKKLSREREGGYTLCPKLYVTFVKPKLWLP